MDPVEFGFTVLLLGLGTLLVGLGVWTLLKPQGVVAGRWAAAYQPRMAAGLLLIGVGILARAPVGVLSGPRIVTDLISLLALGFTLAGAALSLWAAVAARGARRSP